MDVVMASPLRVVTQAFGRIKPLSVVLDRDNRQVYLYFISQALTRWTLPGGSILKKEAISCRNSSDLRETSLRAALRLGVGGLRLPHDKEIHHEAYFPDSTRPLALAAPG